MTLKAGWTPERLRQLGLGPETLAALSERVSGPRFNIAPMQEYVVVREEAEQRRLEPARWGLVNGWAKDNSRAARQINARAETVDTRPAYRSAFQARRCVAPVDGFYEWRGPRGKRQPLWFHRPDEGLLLLAGLWEVWHPTPDREETTFTILTTAANALVAPIHDRMPVVLSDDDVDAWLQSNPRDLSALKELLQPAPEEWLVWRPASVRVNNVRNDDAGLLEGRRSRGR